MFKDEEGTWYHCFVHGLWHQTPLIPGYEHELPVLFLQVHPQIDEIRADHETDVWDQHLAIFATYRPDKQPFMAKAHTRMTLTMLTQKESQSFDTLADLAHSFQDDIRQGRINLPKDESKTLHQMATYLQGARSEQELSDLVAAMPIHDSSVKLDGHEAGVKMCAGYMRYFYRVGEWYRTRASAPSARMRWCID